MPWASGDSLNSHTLNTRGASATSTTGFSTNTIQSESGTMLTVSGTSMTVGGRILRVEAAGSVAPQVTLRNTTSGDRAIWRAQNDGSIQMLDSSGDTVFNVTSLKMAFSGSTINIAEANAGSGLGGGAAGTAGDIAWGSSSGATFLYLCVSANSWMRIALSPF